MLHILFNLLTIIVLLCGCMCTSTTNSSRTKKKIYGAIYQAQKTAHPYNDTRILGSQRQFHHAHKPNNQNTVNIIYNFTHKKLRLLKLTQPISITTANSKQINETKIDAVESIKYLNTSQSAQLVFNTVNVTRYKITLGMLDAFKRFFNERVFYSMIIDNSQKIKLSLRRMYQINSLNDNKLKPNENSIVQQQCLQCLSTNNGSSTQKSFAFHFQTRSCSQHHFTMNLLTKDFAITPCDCLQTCAECVVDNKNANAYSHEQVSDTNLTLYPYDCMWHQTNGCFHTPTDFMLFKFFGYLKQLMREFDSVDKDPRFINTVNMKPYKHEATMLDSLNTAMHQGQCRQM